MATAYTSLLGLALPVQGELQGTWGDTVNNSITSLLDTAVAGTTTLSTDADVTLTTTTGASNQARQAIILWTASGTTTRYITAPAQSKIYTVINKTGSTQSIVLRGVGPTTGVTIPAGSSGTFAWNGTDFVDVSNYINGNKIINGNLTVNGTTTLKGNTTIGDATADSLTVTSTITSNLLFTDNTYDIGASGATRPRNLYLSGLLTMGGALTVSGATNLNGNVTLGDATADTLTVSALVNSNLLFTDNTYDIGASGANRPRSMYLSNTIYAAAGSFGNTGISVGSAGSIRGTVTFYPSDASSWWHAHNSSSIFTLNQGVSPSNTSGVQLQLATNGQLYLYDQTSTAAGAGAGLWFGNSQGSWAQIKGSLVDGSNNTTGDILFYTRKVNTDASLTYWGRLTKDGQWQLNNSGGFGTSATLAVDALTASTQAAIFYSTSNSFTGSVVQVNCQRAASSAYYLTRMYSDNGGVEQYGLRGDGAAFIRGYVGIGTLNTSYMLNIQPSAGDSTMRLRGGGAYLTLDSTTIGYSSVTGQDNGTQRWSIGQAAFGGANGMQFFSGTAEAARIDSNKNFYFGGTASVFSDTVSNTAMPQSGIAWYNSNSPYVKAVRGKCWNQNATGNGTFYSKIADLPASDAGTLDYIHLRVICNQGWGASSITEYDIIMGNRNGFAYSWEYLGNLQNNTGIVAYQNANGSTSIYAKLNNAFDYIHVDVLSSNGIGVYEQSWSTTAPTGTLVFDSGNSTYRAAFGVSNAKQVQMITSLAGDNLLAVQNTSATGYGISVGVNNNSSGTYRYFEGFDNGPTQRIAIYTNGDVKNTNNSYGALSDAKLKQDIVDATSQWGDIKALRVRKYRFKDQPTGELHIGLIAQEAELVSPGLVVEHPDEKRNEDGSIELLDTTTKSLKYSVLYMKAIKALQEAMERIEQLETKVTALENKGV